MKVDVVQCIGGFPINVCFYILPLFNDFDVQERNTIGVNFRSKLDEVVKIVDLTNKSI